MSAYNPASARYKEKAPGTKDYTGIQTVIVPNGALVGLGHGTVELKLALSPDAGGGSYPFEPTQDPGNARLLTIPGTDTWVAHTIRMYLNGQRLRTSLLVIGGAGNRTITLDPTVPAELGDDLEGEGVKA